MLCRSTYIMCVKRLSLEYFLLKIVYLQESTPTDFLQDHVPIYITLVIGIFLFQSAVLLLMGQPCLPASGLVCFYTDINGPGNSQHLSDWYTFTHFLHGCIFYFITYGLRTLFPIITVNYCYLITLSSAVLWEFIENSPCTINRVKQSGAGAAYNGDSVINSFSDSLACTCGFWISYLTPWWVILLYAIAEEILLGVIIRDNLIMSTLQLIFSFSCISNWQKRKNNIQIENGSDNNV